MNYQEFISAVNDAEVTINRADQATRSILRIAAGRLKSASVSDSVLCELKRELQNYNMQTGKWS